MKPGLRPGVSRVNRITIGAERTISFMGEEARTYATPAMIRDIEYTCRDLIMEHADVGEDSVGMEVAVEGAFELPQLARLGLEDQVFVVAFVRCHGSIKEMERIFGISYPTVKSRLNRIAQSLEFVETELGPSQAEIRNTMRNTIMDRLKAGEISAAQAIRELEALP